MKNETIMIRFRSNKGPLNHLGCPTFYFSDFARRVGVFAILLENWQQMVLTGVFQFHPMVEGCQGEQNEEAGLEGRPIG
jgi:hypothetical protein